MRPLYKMCTRWVDNKTLSKQHRRQLPNQNKLCRVTNTYLVKCGCATVILVLFGGGTAAAQSFVPVIDIADSVDVIVSSWPAPEDTSDQWKKLQSHRARSAQLRGNIEALEKIDDGPMTPLGVLGDPADKPAPKSFSDLLEMSRNDLTGLIENNKLATIMSMQNNRIQDELLAQANNKLVSVEAEIKQIEQVVNAKKGFWDVKTHKFTGNLGLSINPNKLKLEEGKRDPYFNPVFTSTFTKLINDPDNTDFSYSAISLNGLLYIKDHSNDLGSDVEVSAFTGAYTKVFDDCLSATLLSSAKLITLNFYDERFSWNFPFEVALKRRTFADKKCQVGGQRKPESEVSLSYVHTFSNPATFNRREIKLAYNRNFPLGKKTVLEVAPKINFTSYSNLPGGAKLENTDYLLGASISRTIAPKTTLTLKGEIGKRNSTDPLKNGKFADLPVSISLKRNF